MKKWIIELVQYHIIPISFGILFTFIALYFFDKNQTFQKTKYTEIKGKQTVFRGTITNCTEGIQAELELAGSLKNPESITIFGSSELGVQPYSPYFFLPDSLHIPTVAFGHAHHQSFAMFCELLAMQKEIKKTKICILISPSWFETEGTYIDAFLEYIRPNFLKSIIQNKKIPQSYKLEIGKYLSRNSNLIDYPSQSIHYLMNLYQHRKTPFLNTIIKKQNAGNLGVRYDVKTAKNTMSKKSEVNWNKIKKNLQNTFISSIKSNSLFIVDEFYTSNLSYEGHPYRHGKTDNFNRLTNQELKDFQLLVELLKKYNCDASFVIQPLNVYHYNDLKNFNEIIPSVVDIIKQNNFPYMNMFVTKKEDYEPGTLTDVMHLGDYGWMKINKFLVNTYTK